MPQVLTSILYTVYISLCARGAYAAVGEIVSCSDCGADYEISKRDGSTVEIKEAETVGEDWGE